MSRLLTRLRHRKEDGAVALEFMFAFPLIIGAIFAMMDVSLYFHHQSKVQNIVREVTRGIAADGGVLNTRTQATGQVHWETRLTNELVANGKCTYGFCKPGEYPTVDCNGWASGADVGGGLTVKARDKTGQIRGGFRDSHGNWYSGNTVRRAGDFVTCVVHYPYSGIAGAITSGWMGSGLGSILGEYIVEETMRADTGTESAVQ